MQIALIRPGSTDYDTQGRIRGTLDIPMNDIGTQQVAAELSKFSDLEIAVVYCGSCACVLETAQAIADAKSAKLKKLKHLQNLDAGLWQGKLRTDLKQNQPKVYKLWQENPESLCPPEGEMLSEARSRVRTALDKIWKKHHNERMIIGLVVPEPLASLVRSELLQKDLGDLWKAEQNVGSWEILNFEPIPASS